ncbi:PLP-dependent aminotransferase family protein [Paenibacillus sp. NPDC058071]|uniref:MocR-like pyridoxine biosynthesis transcription factor PdxR n=1 Tax=Paenibacillus sp. NPDC058071 TaxID=3346326 RepID=UPI0036D772FD
MEDRIEAAYLRCYKEKERKADALYEALRQLIVGGTVREGERLPSSRKLAERLGMSRGSVNQAYDMLYSEGFVSAERGSGTFAAYRQPMLETASLAEETAIPLSAWARRLAADASFASATAGGREPFEGIDMNSGDIDPSVFPLEEWKTAMYGQIRSIFEESGQDGDSALGHLPLREAIANELRRERGISVSADHICVTSGSMYALALLTMVLIDPGDRVVFENPGYGGIRRAITAAGGLPISAEIDQRGIRPEPWEAKLLFVTPGRQFPTGVLLPSERRTRLLEWASRQNAVIVEDDYDSEFRWGGRPSEPLKALDREGRVIYVGTFSKTMYQSLRLGYLVVPDALREPIRRAKLLLEPHPSSLAEQRALAAFMASGGYSRHLRRMRRLYGRRMLRFREEAESRLSGLFTFMPTDAGLHQYAEWRGSLPDYERLRTACRESGVRWGSALPYWAEGDRDERAVRSATFGFAHLSESTITEAVRRIEECWSRLGKANE